MPVQKKKYALFYVPHSGLHYAGGNKFTDGKGQDISWSGNIPVYASRARAISARERILEKNPERYAYGQVIVLSVETIDKDPEEIC